jgi:hypothetical protein
MELRMYCAYNQTRECFLGLEVAVGDFSYRALSKQGALTVGPNEGLWLRPFRGMPDSGVTGPIDLIYLDKDCCVIDLVESFPAVCAVASNEAIKSVLVLPTHSIFSSETRVGDQLVLCVAEEMQHRLERLSSEASEGSAAPVAALSTQKPLESRDERFAAAEKIAEAEGIRSGALPQPPGPNSEKGRFDSPKSWLRRWWSTEARQARRHPAPGLAAFYWSGLPPNPHYIRDISSTGLFLLTEDRWYPGTLILMALENKNDADQDQEKVISINARVVRCDRDGVALQFVATCPARTRDTVPATADRKKIEEFLQRIGDQK